MTFKHLRLKTNRYNNRVCFEKPWCYNDIELPSKRKEPIDAATNALKLLKHWTPISTISLPKRNMFMNFVMKP